MQFIEQANSHPTIKFTAEVSDTDNTFLDTSICRVKHFSSCHPSGVKKGFIKGEALRLLRTNSSETTFKLQFQTVVRTDGHTEVRTDGHVTITSLPKFFGLTGYQISLAMELR